MPGLLDIMPAAKRVMIPTSEGEAPVDVRGLSLPDVRDLLARFPEVIGMLGSGKVKAADVFAMGPDIVGAIIAAACGSGGVKEAEAAATMFSIGVQAEILTHVIKLTMPKGPGPFVEMLKALGLDVASLSAIASPPSPKPSSPKVTDSAT